MKLLVCIKQVPDTETKIKLNSDGSGIDEAGIKWVMNPYDEFAIEEALKTKEANSDATVTVMSLGPKKRVIDSLRTALAMGADDAIIIDTSDNFDSYATAKALAAAAQQEGPFDLIFAGKLAIDDNASSVPQQIAAFMQLPHTSVVSQLKLSDGKATATRDAEGGSKEICELTGPCVIGANKGLNTPRYTSLPGIMKAKKKPLKEIAVADLGVSDADIRVKLTDFQMPPEKPPIKMIDGEAAAQAQELVHLLKNEAKVL